MAQYSFGAGVLTLYNPAGSPVNPIQVGVLKEVSVDFKSTTKELRGAYRFAVDIAAGPMTISGKFKFQQIDYSLVAAVTGSTAATGYTRVAETAATAIPTTPYTITVAPPNSGTFTRDLGVISQSGMTSMDRVTGTPVTGQYSVSTATYTFAAADTGTNVVIRYAYGVTGTESGTTQNLANSLMGSNTVYSLELGNTFRSKNSYLRLPAIIIPSLSMGWKSEDYMEADMEFSAFVDPSTGNIMQWSSNE